MPRKPSSAGARIRTVTATPGRADAARGRSAGEEPLGAYRDKRDFDRSPEPSGAGRRRRSKGLMFVVQKHAARRLHYDLRLEAGGVLKSWAVPKEPSMEPGVKRLAVHVEDHPLEYGSFEGEIPAGSYGAGRVEIWDRGTYRRVVNGRGAEGDIAGDLERGKVEFALDGRRLRGGFVLVRLDRGGRPNWLLIKRTDPSPGIDRPGRAPADAGAGRPSRAKRSGAPGAQRGGRGRAR